MAKTNNAGKTSRFVKDLVKRVMAEKSTGTGAVPGEPGLSLTVQRYLKGSGEPSPAALEKLAVYLGVSALWLRGNFVTGKHGRIEFNLSEPTAICARCGGALQVSPEGFSQILADGTEIEGDGILRLWPCETCCKEQPTPT
jgi:transcriptional regulator with XRE-family HTH domain